MVIYRTLWVCLMTVTICLSADHVTSANSTVAAAGPQEPRLQGQTTPKTTTPKIPPIVTNLTISKITFSSALISWNLVADVDLAGNVTQFTVCLSNFVNSFIEKKNITANITVYTTESELAYATKYSVCVKAWVDDVMRRNDEICDEFVTLYDPLNVYALAAIAIVVVIALFFVGCHALAFALNPGQASSVRLKNQLLDVQDKRRASRKGLGLK